MRGAEIAKVRGRKLGEVRQAGGAELVGGNGVVGEWGSGSWILRDRGRAGIEGATSDVVEVTANLRCRRDPRLPHHAAALFVPLFRPEEEGLVLLDRPAYSVAVIVAAQIVLLSANRVPRQAVRLLLPQEPVCRIQFIVAAVIVGRAVKLVPTRFGDEVDLCAAGAAILRAVAVAQDLKFLDRVHRGIDKNGALRAFVIIVT